MCQHPLATLRYDAVEEKQHHSGHLSPTPPACTHTHVQTHMPGSSKPQLDRPFAGGEKNTVLALQPKLLSRGSCNEFISLKINLHMWWHLWENPGTGVGGEILQALPAWLGTHVEQGPEGKILCVLFLFPLSLPNRHILAG